MGLLSTIPKCVEMEERPWDKSVLGTGVPPRHYPVPPTVPTSRRRWDFDAFCQSGSVFSGAVRRSALRGSAAFEPSFIGMVVAECELHSELAAFAVNLSGNAVDHRMFPPG